MQRIGEERWTIMGREWNCLCRQTNLCAKQSKNQGKNTERNHKLADVGHPVQQWMTELIKRNYWWPGIKNNVKKYVQEYFKCQQNKVQHMKKVGELHPLKTPEGL